MGAGKVLVVDDSAHSRSAMCVALASRGYQVDDVNSGEAAVERLRETPFDLVLLDMNIAGMGGIETCRAIRSESEVAIIAERQDLGLDAATTIMDQDCFNT
jgi:CheY-like chemotaxis protein